MGRQIRVTAVLLLGLLLLSSGVTWAVGPLFFSGDDADSSGHCQGTACGRLYSTALKTVYNASTTRTGTTGNRILAIMSNSSSTALTALNGWNSTANGGPGAPITFVTTTTTPPISTVNFSNYKMIYVPSGSNLTSGGITQTQLTALNLRKADIQAAVNSGGGVLSLAEQGLTGAYSWLPVPTPLTFSAINDTDIDPTTDMTVELPGVGTTATNMNHGFYHTMWTGTSSLGTFGDLKVLAFTREHNIPSLTPATFGPVIVGRITPVNRAPTATVGLNTSTPATNDTLTATATKSDADGNAVTLTFVWKNGTNVVKTTSGTASLTDTLDLSVAGNGNRGDTITVEVTPNDGTVNGAMVSASATVQNTAPTATVGLNTTTPKTNDTLTATATKDDVDGNAVTLTFVWKNGTNVVKTTSGTASLTDTLDLSVAGNGDRGNTITVEVTPNDGTVNGAMVSASATVQNTAPTATVGLNTTTPKTNDTLTATATKDDVDGNAVTLTFVWKNGTNVVKTTSGTASLTDTLDLSVAGNGDRGNTITVEVTPNDGTVDGALVSASATVQNTAPVITDTKPATVNMSENGSPTAFSLTLNATDVDGDTLTWSISSPATNGTATASGTGASKAIGYTPNVNFNGADSFVVRVSDGNGGTDTITVNVNIADVVVGFKFPFGLAVDSGGNLYVADRNNHKVRKVDPADVITDVAGTGEAGYNGDFIDPKTALLNSPTGVAVSGNVLFIADSQNHIIRRVDLSSPGGLITTVAGTPETFGIAEDNVDATSATLYGPRAVAVMGSTLYIADTMNQQIRKVVAPGTVGAKITAVAGVAGEATSAGDPLDGSVATTKLNSPQGVAVNTAGDIFIADEGNDRIGVVLGADPTMLHTLDTDTFSLEAPSGVAVAADGTLYIADTNHNRVVSVLGGTVNEVAGGLSSPVAVAVSADGCVLYFSDLPAPAPGDDPNHRIQKVDFCP